MTALAISMGTAKYYWDSASGGYVVLADYSAGDRLPPAGLNRPEADGISLGVYYNGVLFGHDWMWALLTGKVIRGYKVRAEVSGGWRQLLPAGVSDHPTWRRKGNAVVYALRGVVPDGRAVLISLPPDELVASQTVEQSPTSYPLFKAPSKIPSLTGPTKDDIVNTWPGCIGFFDTNEIVDTSSGGKDRTASYLNNTRNWSSFWTIPRLSAELTLYVSGVPTRTHAPSVELDASTRAFPIKLAYPDLEPVVGVPIVLRASYGNVAISTAPDSAAASTAKQVVTGADGVAQFYLRALTDHGGDTLRVELPDNWKQFNDLYSPPFGTAPIPVNITTSAPQPAPPTTVTLPNQKCVLIPERPAVQERSAYVTHEDSVGWDAGANSTTQLDGDVELVFYQPPATGVVIGFTTERDDPTDYERITHGLFFHRGESGRPVAQVIESGIPKTDGMDHLSTTEWRVQRVGGAVRYLAGGNVFFRSTVPSTGVLSVGCSIYASGDEVPSQ